MLWKLVPPVTEIITSNINISIAQYKDIGMINEFVLCYCSFRFKYATKK